jgi:hypothetical protein
MLHHIKKLFDIKPKAEETKVEVPYKVESTPEFPVPKTKKTTVKKAPAAKKPRAPRKPKSE